MGRAAHGDRQRSRPKHGIPRGLREAIATVKLAAGDVGIGGLQLSEHDLIFLIDEQIRQVSQKRILDTQTERATTHHEVVDAVAADPGRADEAVRSESILGVDHVELVTVSHELVALVEGVAGAGGVELVGLIE